jgi:alpha-beta hydrolase superfamily lysophospholipase
MRPAPASVPEARAPAQDIIITTDDGMALAATYWPGRTDTAPGALLLHGVKSSRESLTANAAWLASAGYAVLTVDFRGHGESTPAQHSFGLYESRDAKAAFDWLKQQQKGAKVAVVGISLGGAASLLGDEGPLPADALVLQSVYPDIRRAIHNRIASVTTRPPAYLLEPLLSFQSRLRFGIWPNRLSPRERLHEYAGPVMIIGGSEDRATPADETRQLFEAAEGPRQLLLVENADHADMSRLDDALYRRRLLSFLQSHLPLDKAAASLQ